MVLRKSNKNKYLGVRVGFDSGAQRGSASGVDRLLNDFPDAGGQFELIFWCIAHITDYFRRATATISLIIYICCIFYETDYIQNKHIGRTLDFIHPG